MGYLLRHPYLRASLGCATTMNFFTFMATALLILYASRTLGLSEAIIGLAFGIGAIGGLIGAVAAAPLTRRIGAGRLIAIAAVVYPGATAIAALAGGPEWMRAGALAGAEFVAGFAVMCFDIPNNSLQAAVTADDMRSRVSGARSSINYGIRPIGAVVGGLLGTLIGVRETLLISSVGGVLAVLWLIGSPILGTRQLEGLQPPD